MARVGGIATTKHQTVNPDWGDKSWTFGIETRGRMKKISRACSCLVTLIGFTVWRLPAFCQNPGSDFSPEAIQLFEITIRPLLQNNWS